MNRPTVLATAALAVALLALAVATLALWRAHEARALARQAGNATTVQQLLPLLDRQIPPARSPGPQPLDRSPSLPTD